MTSFRQGRAWAIAAVGLLLVGCGGSSQSPATIPLASSPLRQSGQHDTSSVGDLIYATNGCSGTCVMSYPALKYVGSIPTKGDGICSDPQGNIFIPDQGLVTEYAHGGAAPVATLSLPGDLAAGCSVDPKSNNLAVVFKSNGADVAVFSDEQGTPKLYDSHIDSKYCGYDNQGNLFVSGYSYGAYAVSELPKASGPAKIYVLDKSVGTPGQVQWDGHYVTYESEDKPAVISRLSFSGSQATIVGTVFLKGIRHRQLASWLYSGNIFIPYNDRGRTDENIVGVWRYPKGGKIIKSVRKFDSYKKSSIDFTGVAFSVQPK
jgi:hypothetical protein